MIIEVHATALNGDGVLLNGDPTDQNYSLVVNNWFGLPGSGSFRVAGRVVSVSGRGIGMATVQITGELGVAREVRTNPFGYFTFSDVPSGNYTVVIRAKRHTFAQQMVSVTGNVSTLAFQANPGDP